MQAKAPLLAAACLLLAAAAPMAAEPWATPRDAARVRAELTALLDGTGPRHPGTAGNLALEARIAARFAQSPFKSGELVFSAPGFEPGETRLSLPDGESILVYPMHPSLFRPGNFAERQFTAPLVDLGQGTVEDLAALKGVSLDGALGLMTFDSGGNWRRFLRFGLRGFIFIGAEAYNRRDCLEKVHTTEVAVPRFFVPAASGAWLRARAAAAPGSLQVRVTAEPSRWAIRTLRDLWVLVPGSDEDLAKEVVVLTAPMDANCVVPDFAFGAQAGANLHLLLRLLESFETAVPARTVLLVAVNAHTQHFLGERVLAWNLLGSSSDVEQARDSLAADLRVQDVFAGLYARLKLDPPTAEDERLLIEMRSMQDTSTGMHLSVKEPIMALARRDVNELKGEQVRLLHADLVKEERQARIGALTVQRDKFVHVLTLFNKAGVRRTLSELSPEEVEILRGYVGTVIRQNTEWAELNRCDLERSAKNRAVRDALEGRPVKFVINLALTWSGTRIGFASGDRFGAARWPRKWGLEAMRVADGVAVAAGDRARMLADTLTLRGGLPEGHFFPGDWPGAAFFHATGTPAFALRNVFCEGGRALSPADTLDRLATTHAAEVANYVPALVRALLADRRLTSPSILESPPTHPPMWTVQVKAFKFDKFSASVAPELPVPGTFLVLDGTQRRRDLPRAAFVSADVVNSYLALTDSRATALIWGVKDLDLAGSAFHCDADFVRVDHVVDAGEVQQKIDTNIVRDQASRTLPLFECLEIPIYDREDPSAISGSRLDVQECIPLSGRLNTAPRKYGFSGVRSTLSSKVVYWGEGPASFFVEHGERLKLVTRRRRLALNAAPEYPEGRGYATVEELGPDFFAAAARDMAHLNRHRIKKLQGVSDELVQSLLARSETALARMAAARGQNDHAAYLRARAEALGAGYKAYDQTSSVTNDMLKAVVFYMIVMLPFCFFVQKLIFKFVKIEAEMAMFGVLFVATFFGFRMIHPAFRIAQAPEAIFIAFVMGGLGAFVISILHGRFEGEMQLLFRTYAGMDTAEVGYSTVGQKAMLIGVNNMKRRRIRTTLTTATVVLVTFTMLAFTSISRKMSPTIVSRRDPARYTGIMYHRPGNARLDEGTVRAFREVFAGTGEILVRRWLLPPQERDDTYPLPVWSEGGASAQIDAALGLATREDGFLGAVPLAAGRFFSADDADEAVLPLGLARALRIVPEQLGRARIFFEGRLLTVVGFLDGNRFRALKDLNRRPLLPIKSTPQQPGGRSDLDAVGLSEKGEEDSGVFYVDTSSLLLLPVETAARLGAEPFSVSIRLADEAAIWPAVDRFLTISSANKFFIGSRTPFAVGEATSHANEPGVYYVGEGYRTSIGGLSSLIVPLLIAATIILNTMLGSVYERRSEIAVYNAVGLNPNHIGMFFLAESLVYSVIGSVGGYLVGQVLSLALIRTGMVQEINLNFSSLSVVYVILFTIAVVLLSTLYPALVASKAAVPSGKRKWSFPENDGHQMSVLFPFIYQPELIAGIMAYLEEYFARFTEASFGDLIAELDAKRRGRDADGRADYALEYQMALAPFDLGVTQRVRFHAAYRERLQAYQVTMDSTRVSGQDANWLTTNKPFLEKMRTYLLHWRNLDDAEHALYAQRGEALFDEPAAAEPFAADHQP
ncbi:MAG: ABC transporter permease [Kiritimatiellae bacterium]|nr:ABC transporter permease [Kiritimatiellia bacterium]